MTIYGAVLPGAVGIARSAYIAGSLSAQAKRRVKALDWHRMHGANTSLTARHFGVTRETIIRWKERLAREGPRGLEDYSRRPKKVRVPTTHPDIVAAVVATRKQYPGWSKYKIAAVLRQKGVMVSESTAGRILKRRGFIDKKKSMKRRKASLHPRARFPRGFKVSCPGDMVQMDVKHIMLPGGKRHYQFTAIDVLTKQKVIECYPSESSRYGSLFLEVCIKEFPFHVRSLQTDNGSTFQKEFGRACKRCHISHYYIYPRHPKQNSYVEVSHGADEREFYEQGNVYHDRAHMRAALKAWQHTWNTIRPHQSLSQLTPQAYYEKWQHGRLPTKDVVTLQT